MSTLRNIVILGFLIAVVPVLDGSKAQPTVSIEPGDKLLTNEKIKELLTGNTVVGVSRNGYDYTVFYPAYGKMLGELSNLESDEGVWSVKDNMYCRAWNNWLYAEAHCSKVYKRGNQILKLHSDGYIAVQTLKPGNPENL